MQAVLKYTMFSKFYYKRKLKAYKAARNADRNFLNLKGMKHLLVAIECDDYTVLREVEKEVKPLLKNIPKVSFVVFINMPKEEEMSYAVSMHDILLFKEDVVRKLTPRPEVIERIDALEPDVFVNLNRQPSTVIDFLTAISLAKMRVGFEDKKELTELMLAVPEENGFKPFFEKLVHFMGSINA